MGSVSIYQFYNGFAVAYLQWLAYVIMMVADVLAPDRCQAICKHHADLTITVVSYLSYHAATCWGTAKKGQKASNSLLSLLTHWGRHKMAAVLQTTFSNAFSGMKMYEFRCRFHWSLFLRINNIPSLVQIMAYHWPGDEPLSELMMIMMDI